MSWEVTYEARPLTHNRERRLHYYDRAKIVEEWRHAFFVLARAEKIGKLQAINVTVRHEMKHGPLADAGACAPAAKAAIDGLVDAGVIVDDGPRHLRALTYLAPTITGRDALTLHIEQTEKP